MDKKHIKIKTYTPQEDGSIKATTESYFDKLASTKEEYIKLIKTDHRNWLGDLVACADVIKKYQAKQLQITIDMDEWGQPHRITKQWTTRKEDFNKR